MYLVGYFFHCDVISVFSMLLSFIAMFSLHTFTFISMTVRCCSFHVSYLVRVSLP